MTAGPARPLADGELAELLTGIRTEAFRMELQPFYDEPDGGEQTRRFLAGDPIPPDQIPRLSWWGQIVADHVAHGRRVRRVRVHDEPPTGYQQWLRWAGAWNVAAGEEIRYLTRARALQIGLPASLADHEDWWLLDSDTVVTFGWNEQGQLVRAELTTDPQRTARACAWRDLAVHHSTPDRGMPRGSRAPASGVADPPQGSGDPPA